MKTKVTLSFLIVLYASLNARLVAQTPRKDITPTSPEASALTKMINYPVSYNTGIPEIAIPLYEIESGDLKLPIGLSYHSGGFKINEQSTSVGLGWSLSSDIQITRSVNGLDDFTPNVGYLANTMVKTAYESSGTCPSCDYPFSGGANSYDNATALALGKVDGMPDKFSYRLLNKSGSFYFVKNNAGTGYSITPVPYDNIQITYNNGRFTIIDDDGTTYAFGYSGVPEFNNLAAEGLEVTGEGYDAININYATYRISAWKCRSITSATKTESISFTYQAKPVTIASRPLEKIDYFNNDNPCQIGPALTLNNQPATTSTYDALIANHPFTGLSSPKYFVCYPTYTEFHLPYLTYNSGSYQVHDKIFPVSPAALPGAQGSYPTGGSSSVVSGLAVANIYFRGGYASFDGTDKLNSITIRNSSNQLIKTIVFNSSYTADFDMTYPRVANGSSYNGTLYLDKVRIAGNSPNTQDYSFLYHQKTIFGNHLTGSDAWGYYSSQTRRADATGNPIHVPYKSIVQPFYNDTYSPCTNYQPNVAFIIGNPSDTEIPGDYYYSQNGILERIIYPTGGYTDFNFEANLYKETLSDYSGYYPLVQRAGGLRIRSISNYDGKTLKLQSQKYFRYGEMEDGIGFVMNAPPRTFVDGKKVFEGYSYKQNIIYYRNPNNSVTANDKLSLSAWLKETKTTFMSASSLDYSYPNGAPIYYTRVTEYNSDLGLQTGKRVYNYYPQPPGNQPSIVSGTNIPILYTDGLMGQQKSVLDYKYENGKYTLIHSKEYTYITYKNTPWVKVAYSYLNNTSQATPGGPINPNIDIYSGNFNSAAVSVGPNCTFSQYGIVSARMLPATEIEKWVNNGTDVSVQTKQYTYNWLPYLNPDMITTTLTNGDQIRKNFKYCYNLYGTPIYAQMMSATVNMVSQPIDVTVTNITKGQETGRTLTTFANNGSSGFIAPVSVQTSSRGGALETEMSFLYNDNANIIQVTGKNGMVKSYLWGYNYKYPIAEFEGVNYTTAIGTTDVTALQNVTDESQLRTTLSGLRASNPTAMVSTFTYKPLMGLTGLTMPNGLDKFYEYDDFGRLLTEKDRGQHILKKYEYQYRPVDAGSPLLNTFSATNVPAMSTFVQFCNTTPTTYNSVNFSVPGGKYFTPDPATSDQSAENYLSSVGPMQPVGTNGAPASQFSVINLSAFMYSGNSTSYNIYIDLIQDNSIVSSSKFPFCVNGTVNGPANLFYVKGGSYTVSFRQSANEGVSILKFFVSASDGTYYNVKSGDTFTFVPGLTYTIQVTNCM